MFVLSSYGIVACATVPPVQAAPLPSALPSRPTVTFELPSDLWEQDAATTDRSVALILRHRVTQAVVLVSLRRADGRTAADIAAEEMRARDRSGARVGGYAKDPHGDRWGLFIFLYGRSMAGQVMVFHDRDHPEWMLVVTGSWDLLNDAEDTMGLELDGIATYLRVVP